MTTQQLILSKVLAGKLAANTMSGEVYIFNKKGEPKLVKGYDHDGTEKRVYLQAVVWIYNTMKTYEGSGLELDHIDRNKKNNSVINLRLVTPKENCANRVRKRYNFTLDQKHRIKDLFYIEKMKVAMIAEIFECSQWLVRKVIKEHLPKKS